MFSQTVEYALRAAVYLAQRRPDPVTTENIAQATKVPQAYLAKVISSLVKAGLVKSQRGVGGGVTLVRPPEDVNILEVVNAVDPIKRITTCPLDLMTHGMKLCPLHRRVDNAYAMVENAFRSTTLAEILAEPGQSVPLCEVPTVEPSSSAVVPAKPNHRMPLEVEVAAPAD